MIEARRNLWRPAMEASERDTLGEVLRRLLPDLRFAYLFGSIAEGRDRPESDVDIAVDAGAPLSASRMGTVVARLSDHTGRQVDLVDLQVAGPEVRFQVLLRGDVLASPDWQSLIEFQMYTPSQYEDWRIQSRFFDQMLAERFSG
jgi:predicted nucleotidyltransferase